MIFDTVINLVSNISWAKSCFLIIDIQSNNENKRQLLPCNVEKR